MFPQALSHVWDWFVELLPRRSSGGMSVNPLSYAELMSWALLTQTVLLPWEAKLLMRLDDALMITLRPKPSKGKARG